MSGRITLPPALLHRLERTQLTSRRRMAREAQGDRRSPLGGSSLQFLDYRAYSPGDDLRQVDWHVYGRTGDLFVRLYEDERILPVHILIDVSKSMDWGTPNKSRCSAELAAALGYVALCGYDRLFLGFVADRALGRAGPFWGRQQAGRVFEALSTGPHGQHTDLEASFDDYLKRLRRNGLLIFISDLLTPRAQESLRRLTTGQHEVIVVQILAPEDLDPQPAEDIRLIDRETGRDVDLHLNLDAIALYKQRLAEWAEQLAQFCRERGARYIRFSSADDLERRMLRDLERQGVLL